ncbi:splicing factor 3A subunit 3 [Chlorella sorokiniana]|uniref:Splicing factor 3A subunit 3 n=1 Tax=Chlorella sorokiniana TaxID=3076 RepID=A0A2P6U481_CHLSO|nr:splicing factor 3A subunit 3 [Chlorella sorokiniana]|eukprot:PRW61113.1 splicing factor 3A subunit 3 [Chlorella sorokiniana]
MASTLLEETRQAHDDVERLERLIVKDFATQPAGSHKDKLLQSHRVRAMLDSIQERSRKLIRIYDDEDGARKEEIAQLRLGGADNVFSNFYERLKEVREYHRKFPNDDLTEAENDEALLSEAPAVPFSGEEAMGRFLDLHELFHTYTNSKFGKQVDYYTYVCSIAEFEAIPRAQRLGRPYREYLQALVAYLESFYERTQPLSQLSRQYEKLEAEFAEKWQAGQVAGWEDRGEGGSGAAAAADGSSGALDLDAFDSADELEMLGAERLKEALSALGMKCGGTLRQRAERLMQAKGKKLEELDRSLFAKGAAPAAVQSTEQRERQAAAARAVALLEAKASKLCEMLGSVLEDTKGRIEKKQAQTYEELMAEQAEAEEEAAAPAGDESEEEDEFVYNPLKLPLGWDGKPIPYWLYKLHGLNLEFKCEICGGASYWGRRAFERHFREWRHENGMRALGIPNSKKFFEVTQIADAVALWKSLQERHKGSGEVEEEFEDDQGNVYSKKTWEDLRRQGLV